MANSKLFGTTILLIQVNPVVLSTNKPEYEGSSWEYQLLAYSVGFFVYLLLLCVPIFCLICAIYFSLVLIMRHSQSNTDVMVQGVSNKPEEPKEGVKQSPA
uniref:Uncharacterized protein n=1 Tax=Caenorhabditis japonica TaxID=281687 RepID=A0A8R1E7D4_CAEJA